MGFDSIWHWLILLVVVLVIFGTGKLTKIGPDLGKAVREFKKAIHGDDKDKDAQSSGEKLKADPPESATAEQTEHKQHDSNQSK